MFLDVFLHYCLSNSFFSGCKLGQSFRGYLFLQLVKMWAVAQVVALPSNAGGSMPLVNAGKALGLFFKVRESQGYLQWQSWSRLFPRATGSGGYR